MSEEIKNVLDRFDEVLENYELDKKVGQLSIDSIYFLHPSEMITIKNYIRQNENIIKEVREYIEKYTEEKKSWLNGIPDYRVFKGDTKELLEILDKEVN